MRLPLRHLLGAAVVGATTVTGGCARAPEAAPTTRLVLATGGQGGAYYMLGPALAKSWVDKIPGIDFHVEPGGSGLNVESLQVGTADIAFMQADIAYAAYSRGTEIDRQPHAQLRAMAVLWMNILHVAVRRDSPAQTIEDLRGRRVSVNALGSGTETLAKVVLQAYGLDYGDVEPQYLSFVDTMQQLRDGRIDAAFVVAGPPAIVVADVSESPGIRLLPISRDRIATMRAQYPFLQPIVVPAGTYTGIERDVDTLGVSNLLMCRKELDERLVYQLTRGLFEAVPQLGALHPAARRIDPEEAPATPIPLHPGAARYYREREITR